MVEKCPTCGQPIRPKAQPRKVVWPKLSTREVRMIWRSLYRGEYLANQFDITLPHVRAIKDCRSINVACLKYGSKE